MAEHDEPTAAHIHLAPAGVPGPVVVPLSPIAGGCASLDEDLVRDIKADAEDYYGNVHNAAFPAGAIRAQLR